METEVLFGKSIPGRIYRLPSAAENAPSLVLVHGVHRLGIDEPRFVRFARAIAREGFTVMTPLVHELADYRVEATSIGTVEDAVHFLAERSRVPKVGLIGFSFGGGVSLLAASTPRTHEQVSCVLSVGGHDDLERVSTYFATNLAVAPDESVLKMKAHDYGALVVAYARAEEFFPKDEAARAGEAIRLWLWEERDQARARLSDLSPASRRKLERLFDHDIEPIRDELRAVIAKHSEEMALVSPHGHLSGMSAHVFVLHGAGDSVIPPTEAAWLAADLPGSRAEATLVSPALVHVELGRVSTKEKWDLLHFFAGALGQLRDTGA